MSEPEVVAVTPAIVESDRTTLEFQLDDCLPMLWFWQAGLFVALFILLPAFFTALIAMLAGGHLVGWIAILIAALALVVPFIVRRYAQAYRAKFRGQLLGDALLVSRGVFWHSEILVPRSRVQHTDVNQGPIARRFGVAKLVVYTAGTHEGEIAVDCLPREVALSLRDRLLGREGHDAV